MEMLQSDVVVGRLVRALTWTVDAVDHGLGQISELGSDPAPILEQHKQRAWGCSWHSSCAAKPLLKEPERSGITTAATVALFTVPCITSMDLIVTIFALCTGACVARMGTLGTQDSRFK